MHHKAHIYLEYHSACPFVRIETPTPSPPSECVTPRSKKRGNTRLRVREGGGGVPIRTKTDGEKRTEKKPSTLYYTLRYALRYQK